MSTKTHDCTPAFPLERIRDLSGHIKRYETDGMTLRDYFAAKALAAILGNSDQVIAANKVSNERNLAPHDGLAQISYEFADAMMEARK